LTMPTMPLIRATTTHYAWR